MPFPTGTVSVDLAVCGGHADASQQIRYITGHDDRGNDFASEGAVFDLITAGHDTLDAPVFGVFHAAFGPLQQVTMFD